MRYLFIPIIAILLTSCNMNPLDAINNTLSAGESGKIKQMSSDIIKCFTEKDKETFKNLFCEQVRNNPCFDQEIDKAFEYLNCDIYTTSTIKDSASGGYTKERGTRIEWYVSPEIPYFNILTKFESETDLRGYEHERYYYSINYYWQITYEADRTLEGLHYIVIELLNVDRMIIGEKTSITKLNPFGFFHEGIQ